MKRKPAGSNHKAIQKFLSNEGEASAIEIKKATRVRGSIYSILSKMVDLGILKKTDNKYRITLGGEKQNKPNPQPPAPNPQPPARNPDKNKIDFLLDEIEYVKAGITSLNITLSYLERRVEQLKWTGLDDK